MKLHYSTEGAYAEAVEASAERILFVSKDSGESSGYSSDNEASNAQDLEACSVDSRTSSSLSGYSTSKTEDAEQDDIESEILFLQEKQSLLKRAISAMKREDAYEASRARDTVNGKNERKDSSLWDEAREIVDILNRRDDDESPVRIEKRHTREIIENRERSLKKPRIDVSSVTCVSSGTLDGGKEVKESSAALQRAIPTMPFVVNGPWMGQALAGCSPSAARGWEVLNDPDLGLLVVPPSVQSFQKGVELKDALALTPDAQLVTLSTPPFYVVHANRAFCLFSGLLSADIIGKPIESLLQVVVDQDTGALDVNANGGLSSSFVLSRKLCQLEITPVTDKFRNLKGGMSHLLVKVQARDSAEVGHDHVSNGVTGSLISKNLESVRGHHEVFGAVG